MKTRGGLRLGISLPQSFPEERIDHAYLRAYVKLAEDLGFEDGWLTEGILSPNFHLEPVSYAAHLAALTTRLRLGIAVIILNTRNPVQLAKSLATVDQLSNGRLIVGLGIMIGGLATMCPERRDDVVSLGLKSIVSGTLCTCILGAVVGLIGG